ncbi:MAG: Lrp/AsnC family transcriptional regulator [Verrucomicrobiaceae bacterium]
MDPLIELLPQPARRTPAELAPLLGITESEVAARIAAAEADGTILGYSAVVDRLKAGASPARDRAHRGAHHAGRDGGFDRLAKRIAKFDQVREGASRRRRL